MISILTSPSRFAGAKNPMVIQVATDKYITTAGDFPVLILNFDAIPVDGGTFSLQFRAFNETFTCRDTPDDSGLEFCSNNNGPHIPTQSLEDYVATLAQELMEINADLRNNYDISSTYDGGISVASLIFTGKRKGSADDIDSAAQAGSWVYVTLPKVVTSGVEPVYSDNFTLECAIEFEADYGSGEYGKLVTQSLYPSEASDATFYLDEALKAALKNDSRNLNLPTYGQANVNQASKIARRYRAVLLEKYGTSPLPHKQEVFGGVLDAPAFVLFGGLNPIEFPDTNLVSYLSSNKKFLSFDSGTKEVTTVQHEYLYFPSYASSATDLKLYADVYYTDGTSNLNNLLKTKLAALQYEVYLFPAGYTQLDIGSIDAGRIVDYYDLKIKDGSAVLISELRRYKVLYKENYRTRYFLFLNSLGAYETLRTTGITELNPKYSDNVVERLQEYNYKVPDPQYESLGRVTDMQYLTGTGYQDKAKINHLSREFENTERLYLVSRETGGDPPGWYIPLILLDAEQKAEQDDQTLSALQFKYRLAFDFGVHSKVWDVL